MDEVEKIRELLPSLKIIAATGSAADKILAEAILALVGMSSAREMIEREI
jgi:hypothetical protein